MQRKKLFALISDLHANRHALQEVVKDARRFDPQVEFWCLGDVFGRGPSPTDVWDRLQLDICPTVWLAGNWDWGLIGRIRNVEVDGYMDGEFKKEWWQSLVYQEEQIRHARSDYQEICQQIAALPQMAVPYPGIYVAHGCFDLDLSAVLQRKCVSDYIWFDKFQQVLHAWETLRSFIKNPQDLPGVVNLTGRWDAPRLLAVGHTHLRGIYWYGEKPGLEPSVRVDHWYSIPADRPALVNPGSVGFPRVKDQAGCASYALLEIQDEHWRLCFRDVWFDCNRVIELLDHFGYPEAIRQSLHCGCPEQDRELFIHQYLAVED